MIVLDTNVISEALKPAPHEGVIQWLDSQALETLFLSAISLAELRSGLEILKPGKKRDLLREKLELSTFPMFAGRVLPFDQSCTQPYAEVIASSRRKGFPISAADAFIAAIAITNVFSVATRDTRPFVTAGVSVIDPWSLL